MNAVLAVLGSRVAAIVVALVALALLIWFAGPLFAFAGHAPLAGVVARLVAIGALLVLAALWLLLSRWRARRREARLLNALADDGARSAADAAAAEERAVLREKMESAVTTLRSRSAARERDGRFVYELPWYAIIGPPGAGKTTLIANSGLEFPLEETHGRQSLKGLGGTRDCDWWFTDRAVLLDTAGRYATQDSDREIDSAAWASFLGLLKETRPRRPLNGVLVALSVADILDRDEESVSRVARELRARVEELQRELGIVPPVYLLFTKCDLLAGFDAFFGDIEREARDQVWGFTLPLAGTGEETSSDAELDRLVATLQRQTLGRLHGERSAERREGIYTFPLQFAALRRGVGIFVERFAARSRLTDDVLLRGVYFTSATQTGDVLDRVIARVAAGVGLPATVAPAGAAPAGRSYFIRRLLDEVVFAESGLAGTDPRTERRLARAQIAVAALVLVGLVGLVGLWALDHRAERERLARVESRAAALERALAALPSDTLDPIEVTRVLDLALALDEEAAEGGGSLPVLLGGFRARPSLERLTAEKYESLLSEVLLPRLMTRLEHRMQGGAADEELLFEALKTYLMIGLPERFDADAVRGWFRFDVVGNLPSGASEATRTALTRHIDALFDEPPPTLPRALDAALVARSREIAARLPLAERAYARLRGTAREALERHLALSGVSAALPELFTLEDGRSLDRAVPRLFTVAGYRDAYLPASAEIAERLAEERWVLGDAYVAADVDAATLAAAVERRYEDDYIAAWQTLLDGLRLRPIDGLEGAARTIARLTAEDSPLVALLGEAARQTAPRAALAAASAAAAEAGATADGGGAAAARADELAELLGGADGASRTAGADAPPEDRIAAHFRELHDLLAASAEGRSPLDRVLGELAGLNAQLLAMVNAAGGAGDPALARELAVGLQTLGFSAERLAEPLASIVGELSDDITDAAGSGLCRELETAWQSEVLAFWHRALQGRYPLYRKALSDVALADFAAFFGPDGRLPRFVEARLGTLVTKTPGRWSWSGSGASCLSEETLRQLALAEEIRDTFFAAGTGPRFSFDLAPGRIVVSPEITLLQLQVGAARADYFHGPVAGTSSFVWPDPGGALQASLRVEPVVPGGSSGLTTSGPWAILRLLDQGVRTRRDAGLQVDYSFSGRPVSLGFSTSSFNPLDSVALRNFRAPETL